MKTEVYSWRVSRELKSGLEREARRSGKSLSAVLDIAAKQWLAGIRPALAEEDEQRRLHEAAAQCFGTISRVDRRPGEAVRDAVRRRLQQRHGR